MDKPVIASVTLAEIYLEQGHIERSMEVYAELVRREPCNKAYKKSLAVLKKEWKAGQKKSGTLRQVLGKKLW
jgi:cytochrome c-type biogenesis protein CcmH/NrfG